MTWSSARSRSASSGRSAASYASADSRRFLASRPSTVSTSSSDSARASLPATSSFVIAVNAIRIVADVTSSRALMAVVRSDCNWSLRALMEAFSHR